MGADMSHRLIDAAPSNASELSAYVESLREHLLAHPEEWEQVTLLSENFTSAPMRAFTTNAGLSMHCSNVSNARSLSSTRRMSEGVRVLKLQNEESLSFDR